MTVQTTATSNGAPLLLIEGALTLAVLAFSLCCRRAHSRSGLFSKVEILFGRLARRRALAVLVVGLTAGTLRLLTLPRDPIPEPFIHDDFSYLLAADTFASGRLTNPTHPMWVHFESFHITQKPTYMSMYFPAKGMLFAAGKVLVGQPWWGVWASVAIMCALICWMLQGWLPPGWALLGGMLAILRLGLFSYWIDSYTGGEVAAIGGALVLGALPRIQRSFRLRDFFWMAAGMALLANSRPYEGLLVCIPAVAALGWRLLKKPHPDWCVLARRMAPGAALLIATVAFMGYYDYRVFGNVFTPPYAVNRATYASAPHFIWQAPRPEPVYRYKVMQEFYSGDELKSFLESRTLPGFFEHAWVKLVEGWLFFLSFSLAAPLMLLPWALGDRRIRFLAIAAAVFALGLAVETWLIPHYIAPFTAALYAILLQSMRHLRVWRPGGRASGLFLTRAIPVLCVVLAGLRLYAQPLRITLPERPTQSWYGNELKGQARARTLKLLESYAGPQLAIVRYSGTHDVLDDWVYNAADIDKSKVVWAREADMASNRELIRYFKSRKAWLVEPDFDPPKITPYTADEEIGGTDNRPTRARGD